MRKNLNLIGGGKITSKGRSKIAITNGKRNRMCGRTNEERREERSGYKQIRIEVKM